MPYPKPGYYYSTSAPLIVGGNDHRRRRGRTTIISTQEPSGVIRAYDVATGALVWNLDSGNPDADDAAAGRRRPTPPTRPTCGRSPSVDEKLGLALRADRQPDAGPARRGIAAPNVEKFSSSIVALDLDTGQLSWVRPDGAPRPLGHGCAGAAEPVDITRSTARVVPALVQADQAGRPLCARPAHRRAGAAGQGSAGAGRRRRRRPHLADAAGRPTLSFKPEAADRSRHVGHHRCSTSWRAASRSSALRYEGRYTPPSAAGLADLSRQFRRVQLGRRRCRSGPAGHVRHADLSGVHVAAHPARPTCRRRTTSERQRAGAQPQ